MLQDAQPELQVSDTELLSRVLAGEKELFGVLVRRYNRRLYHLTRAVVQSDVEAEDVVQESFVRAFEHLRDFEGRALFSTWLTRIAVHEALNRRRQQRREALPMSPKERDHRAEATASGQEQGVLQHEMRHILEAAIDALPERYRLVFMMRHVEEMSTAETARCLGISEENVKVRLVRARKVLRHRISSQIQADSGGAFELLGERCDRVTANVLARILAPPQVVSQ